jgi:hypothetical protein
MEPFLHDAVAQATLSVRSLKQKDRKIKDVSRFKRKKEPVSSCGRN